MRLVPWRREFAACLSGVLLCAAQLVPLADELLPDVRERLAKLVDAQLLVDGPGPVPLRRAVRIDKRYADLCAICWLDEKRLAFFTHENWRSWGHMGDDDHIVGTIDLEEGRARHALFIPPRDWPTWPYQGLEVLPDGRLAMVARRNDGRYAVLAVDLDERDHQVYVQGGDRAPPDTRFLFVELNPSPKLHETENWALVPEYLEVRTPAGRLLAQAAYPPELWVDRRHAAVLGRDNGYRVIFSARRKRLNPDGSEGGILGWPIGRMADVMCDDLWEVMLPSGVSVTPFSPRLVAEGSFAWSTPDSVACLWPQCSRSGRYLAYASINHTGDARELRLIGPQGDIPVSFQCELDHTLYVRDERGVKQLKTNRFEHGSPWFAPFPIAFSADEKTMAFVRGHWLWLADLSKLEEE